MGLAMSGERFELRTEVQIEAPAAKVWETLLDTASYPTWNPFIASVEGPIAEGSEVRIVLTPPGGRESRVAPRIVTLDQECEWRWVRRVGARWLLQAEHFFRLQSVGEQCTRLIHGEDYRGLLVKYLGTAFTQTARGFVGMNQALKARVESDS